MTRVIKLVRSSSTQLPPGEDDVTFPEELVETFLAEFTRPGDLVFDPFAGFGTTLVVAERMGRRALGLELLPERVAFVQSRLADPNAIIQGDALRLADLDLPAVDFVMTSPPFMNNVAHPQNPLTGYRTLDGEYSSYLRQLRAVFEAVGNLLKPGRFVIINVADIRTGAAITPLASDLAQSLSSVMTLQDMIRVEGAVADGTIETNYCLVFRPR
jgi:DNA modification methylase